jgi:hypothetical protein
MEEIDPQSAPAFAPPERIGEAFLYENPDALARAILVRADRTRPMAPALAAGGGPLPPLDWRTEALVGIAAEDAPPPAGREGPAGRLAIVEHAPGRLVAEVDPAAEAYVVHHELRMPGWVARVDGEPRPLVPANGLFQAVKVRPGEERVELVFSPLAALLGP